MSTIVLASIMRNGCGYLDRYLAQVQALRSMLEARSDTLINVVAEGDSTDETWPRLQRAAAAQVGRMRALKLDHGGPEFGSIDNPTRWQNIARTWNRLFDRIQDIDGDALIYVEADLVWKPETMVALLAHLDAGYDAVAPMSMMGDWFYDTWGHRAQGRNFRSSAPYHDGLVGLEPGQLLQIESAGSCKALRWPIVQQCRFSEVDAMIGHSLYQNGYSFWLDPSLAVRHA
jgi:hypothetical protein